MLDERKAAILRAVVEEYIATAQPVGSAHVVRSSRLGVSPATVRNEMAVLEHEGYLIQPHTSAGRIPTDRGYRAFVDQLVQPGGLSPSQSQLVREFFAHAHGELEEMLRETSALLSRLTAHAGLVLGPLAEAATIRSVQLVGLSARAALVVAVLSNGSVEKWSMELPADVGEERVGAASAQLATHLVGRTLCQLRSVPSSGDAAVDRIVQSAVAAMEEELQGEPEHVYVAGASQIALAFEAVETVRQVLATVEKQYVLVSLLRDLLDRGLSVSIGSEHGLAPLAECSIVVAPYEVAGERAGTIAVLGPTRMNYPQAMAAVALVGNRLGRRLSEG